jgi:hypothetical protein
MLCTSVGIYQMHQRALKKKIIMKYFNLTQHTLQDYAPVWLNPLGSPIRYFLEKTIQLEWCAWYALSNLIYWAHGQGFLEKLVEIFMKYVNLTRC